MVTTAGAYLLSGNSSVLRAKVPRQYYEGFRYALGATFVEPRTAYRDIYARETHGGANSSPTDNHPSGPWESIFTCCSLHSTAMLGHRTLRANCRRVGHPLTRVRDAQLAACSEYT